MSIYVSTKVVSREDSIHKQRSIIGLWIDCGRSLTLFGLSFTLENLCSKCNNINVFKSFFQPIETRRVTDMDNNIHIV